MASNGFESNQEIVVDFRREGPLLFVNLAGDADLFSSSLLKRRISSEMEGVRMIIFDLADVEFADSYFIRLLIQLIKRLGGVSSVTAINAKPNVKHIFEVTGLDKLFIR